MAGMMIVGEARSGTSWVGAIFDSHPDVLYLHEPDVTEWGPEFPRLFPREEWDAHLPAICDYLDRLGNVRHFRAVLKHPGFRKSWRSGAGRLAHAAAVFGLRVASRVAPSRSEAINMIPLPHFGRAGAARLTVLKSVDSLPRMPAFARARPDMRFLHLVRHPCGFVASQLRGQRLGKFIDLTYFPEHFEFAPARRRGMTAADVERLDPIERQAWRWLVLNEWAMESTADLPNVRAIAYDAIADDPIAGARELFDWAGLDWARQSAAFLQGNLRTSEQADGFYSVRRHPSASANAWRTQLAPGDIGRILAIVAGSAPSRLFETRG